MLLPRNNSYAPGDTAVFHELFDRLVKVGEENTYIALPFQLHAFLVQCLAEHVRDRAIGHHVLALNVLRSAEKHGEHGNAVLKRTGDAALLLAGLFPERASRLHVSPSYFRLMGQGAYGNLSVKFHVTGRPERGRLYDNVTVYFHLLERVLNAVRLRPELPRRVP